jgi:hypothetical protein
VTCIYRRSWTMGEGRSGLIIRRTQHLACLVRSTTSARPTAIGDARPTEAVCSLSVPADTLQYWQETQSNAHRRHSSRHMPTRRWAADCDRPTQRPFLPLIRINRGPCYSARQGPGKWGAFPAEVSRSLAQPRREKRAELAAQLRWRLGSPSGG